jgi:hypothetical protein
MDNGAVPFASCQQSLEAYHKRLAYQHEYINDKFKPNKSHMLTSFPLFCLLRTKVGPINCVKFFEG